jgi:hypothetical protein
LPNKGAPDQVKRFPNLDPAPRAKPDLQTLQALLGQRTSGFPIPRSLP